MIKYFTLALAISSCSMPDYTIDRTSTQVETKPQEYPGNVASEFTEYYAKFFKLYGVIGGQNNSTIYVPSKFNELEDNVIGRCYWGLDWQYIDIDKSFWMQASESERETLIFHELGHCVLKREHNSKMNADNMPESIMYPSIIGGYTYYTQHTQEYYNELFKVIK